MPTYQPNIPTGSVPLNADYLNLQGNFQQLNVAYGYDHVPFSDTSGLPPTPNGISGLHKAIHQVPVSTVASNGPTNQPINGYTATTGFNQILSAQINDGINTDTALYSLTSGNRLQQLTRNFVPVPSSPNGYTFIPGGLILQWGFVNGSHAMGSPPVNVFDAGDTGTVTFATSNIAFPNSIINVFTQVYFTSTSSQGAPSNSSAITISIDFATMTKTQFKWKFVGSGSSYTKFTWYALGT